MTIGEKVEKEFGDSVSANPPGASDQIDEVAPEVILTPQDADSAAALVAWCGKENHKVIARGGGSKLHIGAAPNSPFSIIDTAELNEVFDHDEGNATVAAGSGISLAKLDEQLAQHGQFLPVDYIDHPAATLGGVVATNHYGATKPRYGTPRDMVVGLHAAISDGRYIKAGSKVVKNVSGYDLGKLFVGSFGSLGLITQVTIRLRPKDAASADWHQEFSDFREAKQVVNEILHGPFEPAMLRLAADKSTFRLHARFCGAHSAVGSQIGRLPASSSAETEKMDSELELRAGLPLARAGEWLQAAREAGADRVLWDCAHGAVRAVWKETPDDSAETIANLRSLAEKVSGFLVAEKLNTKLKTHGLVWGTSHSANELKAKLKSTFDAADIFGAGRTL